MVEPAIPAPESTLEPVPASAAAEPDVTVVVVTYNSEDVLERCLRALPGALDGVRSSRVIVVDNDSGDRSVPLTRRLAPWATVLESGGNVGYAAAVNIGQRHAPPGLGLMVLNPDTEPRPRSIQRLAEVVERDPDVGIAVPRIEDEDGRLYLSLRREPTIPRALGAAVLGGRRAGAVPALSEVVTEPDRYVDGARADWATGAALLVARRAIDRVGAWAEDFFLYSEETDYALRVRDAGLLLTLVSDAVVRHKGGDMGRSPALWSLQAVNRTRLYRRRHGPVSGAAFWCAVALNEALRAATGPTHRAALRSLVRDYRRRDMRP